MILRMWKGQASAEKADQYVQHATRTVFPKLQKIEGHRGAYLLRHPIKEGAEFVVLTLWDSMEAIREFSGEDLDHAVVDRGAESLLTGFDDRVTHFEVVHKLEDPRQRNK
jgi:heme-degrading monooxygenase HmoA